MRISLIFFVLGLAILSGIGCKKETVNVPDPVHVRPEVLRTYSPPAAYAAEEGLVFLPADSFELYGWSSPDPYATISCMWRKISGPSSYKINSPNLLRTRVNDLVKGVYEFELTVKDDSGSIDADTMSVIVGEMSTREIYIKNVNWGYDGFTVGSFIYVTNIYNLIPVGSVFKVFVNRNMSGEWVEAKGYWRWELEEAPYTLTIYDSYIIISTLSREFPQTEIKIIY